MAFGPFLLLALMEGMVSAAVLALSAVGLCLVFGVMRVVNVAHGEFFMLGAVLAWFVAALVPGPAGARLRRGAGRGARWRSRALAAIADRLILKRLELRPGGDHRRHDRVALHHPAGGADALRPRRAPGGGALYLAHPAAVVRLFGLQAFRRRGGGGGASGGLGGPVEKPRSAW